MINKTATILSKGDNRENLIGRECVVCKEHEHGVTVFCSYYSELFPFSANYFFLPFSAIQLNQESKNQSK